MVGSCSVVERSQFYLNLLVRAYTTINVNIFLHVQKVTPSLPRSNNPIPHCSEISV